jgi:multidrug resistance efflux pump
LRERYDTILDGCVDTSDGEVCPLHGPVEETTRARLQAAEARVQAAQASLDRLLEGPTAAQERAADAGVSAASARRDRAQAQLALLEAGATPQQIRQAEVALEIAEAQVAVAQAQVADADAARARAQAGVEAARAGLDGARAALDRATLEAPFAGTVVTVQPNPGELVAPQAPVVTLADGEHWLVETQDLTELDVAQVEEGHEVNVTFAALPQAAVRGTVTQIALTPGMDRGDVVYEATIALDEEAQALPLRWGMTAQVQAP